MLFQKPGGLLLIFLLLQTSFCAVAQAPARPVPLLPLPQELRWGSGRLNLRVPLRVKFEASTSPELLAAAQRTLVLVQGPGPAPASQGPALSIRYGPPAPPADPADEQYHLLVTPLGVSIEAATRLGVLRALATLQQLPITEKKQHFLPTVDIRDAPRFGWRGLLLDAARHFLPVAVVKRTIDGMAAVKLNVLHWHLTDDQAFRVESRTFPRLTQASADGLFYTQAQVRDVLAYAAARGIRVVPEFDVPSHTTSWIVAYPRLASIDTSRAPNRGWRTTNIALDPTRETTFTFVDSLFREMTALFPDPYFHAGGDENDGRQWKTTPHIVAFARKHGMLRPDSATADKHQLQLYFSGRVAAILHKYGKTMVGWDEILGPKLPPEVVIQSWRGKQGLTDAVQQGHPALLSAGYYLDLNYPAATYYAADPLPANPPLTPAQQARVLGGEAAMWGEFADSVVLESRVWPRAAAVAERLWSQAAATQNVPDLYRRLGLVSAQLERLGLHHRRAPAALLRQLAGSEAALPPLQTLAAVLEPVKEYKRHFQGFAYRTTTPLTRLVDAAPAESDAARNFGTLVDSVLAGLSASPRPAPLPGQLLRLQTQLATWQANDVRLQPLLLTAPGLREYAPLSAGLSAVATVLLARLAALQTVAATAPPPAARAVLDAAAKPAGQAELAIVPAARRLLGLP